MCCYEVSCFQFDIAKELILSIFFFTHAIMKVTHVFLFLKKGCKMVSGGKGPIT